MPEPIKKDNNFKNLIQDTVNLYKLSEKNLSIDLDYASNKDSFKFDLNQISRVLVNIMKNSLEAIHEKLEIEKNLKGKITIKVEDDNDFIYVTIEDNGIGFRSKPKDLTSPLATTKQHGSGLGLSIVSKILHEHGGDLNFLEKEGGAKVKLNIKINS